MSAPPQQEPHRTRSTGVQRVLLAAATAFIAINLWTGAPLFALWVGSQVVGKTVLSMKAVFVVVIVLSVLVFAMLLALVWLNATYDRITGRPSGERRMTWLRSVRAEGTDQIAPGVGISALEHIVMISVYVAVIALLVWFFFLAGSPLPHA